MKPSQGRMKKGLGKGSVERHISFSHSEVQCGCGSQALMHITQCSEVIRGQIKGREASLLAEVNVNSSGFYSHFILFLTGGSHYLYSFI